MLNKPDPSAEKKEAVVIKKYANRRLYNTETSTYVTLEDLAAMVRSDRDFVVYDAKSGDDLTHSVLTQIIVEQENRVGGQTLLPVPFLRQLIRFYDDSIGRMVPGYLQFSMENLVKDQEKLRSQFTSAFSNPTAAFEVYQDLARKNMQMFEQAVSMWSNPFTQGMPGAPKPPGAQPQGRPQPAPAPAAAKTSAESGSDIDDLKAQLASMQQKLDKLSQDRD
ncbi:PhbF [Hyphomicrobium sulfonivorans]|uniref:PhbF n=1 Tax=Hyphomicrobium sulfonivorans TaxID=121290 RepID=A0A109BBZ0_HYPSL|nr:polyhydroxyalkanoate synthesis repressor PhaR [Hyphomicrobium sulfonivorans]KWT65780.1 PhbF [Hyphomicrobium sulfonivorans]